MGSFFFSCRETFGGEVKICIAPSCFSSERACSAALHPLPRSDIIELVNMGLPKNKRDHHVFLESENGSF